MTKYVCHVCKKIMDKHQYDSHLMGQKHMKNVEKIRIESQTSNLPINSSSFLLPRTWVPPIKNVCIENSENVEFVSEPNGWFFCNLCQIPCNSHDSLTDHLKGIKHLKKRNVESHAFQQMLTNSNNLAGHEFIEAECHTELGKAVQYKCNLCCCEVTEGSLVGHLKGRRHKQNYKQQVDSSVTVGPKSPVRTMKKMLKNLEKKRVKELFWRNKDDHLSIRRKRTFEKFNKLHQSDDDDDDDGDFNECIMKKYKLIAMEPTILQVLLWFCNCCESTLKLVSDEFLTRDGHDDDDDSKWTLRRTMRVGVLGNRQILKSDKNFDLVLVLSTKVSLSLLETMRDCLSSKLRSVMFGHEFEKDADFVVKMKPEMPCLEVCMVHPFTFDVSISVVSSRLEKVDVKEEGDYLNMTPGMASLKQLMRADWFQTRLNYLSEGLRVLMILRQLKSEDDVWNILGDWVNEVLIEKCTFIQSFTSTPSSVMRCYLELLSSGLLLDGSGLRDPCENELTDLFKNLTAQEKENITRHAQKCLRLLALKKSHIFLKVEACSSKRNGGQD